MSPKFKPFSERVWAKVDKRGDDECWRWNACGTTRGYGIMTMAGENFLAHRLIYELCVGAIPEGIFVLHRCDNRRCVNPAHLFLGTAQDNKGERNSHAKLTELAVISIRRAPGLGYEIAKQYGVTPTQISNIKRRKSWRHVA